jgi:predicted TIM-barrel fold metal-dependent hydrolase
MNRTDGRIVIDFRARANTAENAKYLYPRLNDIAAMRLPPLDPRVGWYRAPIQTLADFIAQMDGAGIDISVMIGRNRAGRGDWTLTNEYVAECVARYPDRLVGFAGIDAEDLEHAVETVRRGIRELHLAGVALDPFQIATTADDRRFDQIYLVATELGVPVVITQGAMPGIPVQLTCHPLALDAVAQRFPELVLIACHGGWPFLTEIMAVAWRRPNVYFDNSFYHFAPGAEVLVEAANQFLAEKMIYASAYPFAPLEETLERFRTLPFDPLVLDKVLGENAARLLASQPAVALQLAARAR